MKSLSLSYFICKNWVMGGNWTRTRVLSSYTGRSLAGTMVRWARWGLKPTEVSQLRGSHLLLSLCQWSQAELEVIQTAMGNISISLNMKSVSTVLANETFLQESNQQLWTPGSSVPIGTTLRVVQQLACESSIQKSIWTPGKMVIKFLRSLKWLQTMLISDHCVSRYERY